MLHVSQLVEGEIYKLYGKTVKLAIIYAEELAEAQRIAAIVVYDTFQGFTTIRSDVRANGMTDFEELTPLEKELL
jgi:hypothetical protein